MLNRLIGKTKRAIVRIYKQIYLHCIWYLSTILAIFEKVVN
jgi:hypothetical protein